MRKLLTLFMTAAFALTAAAAHPDGHDNQPPWQKATSWPDRIIVTHAGDPMHSFSVTWRTDQSVSRTIAQIAPATSDARFDLAADSVSATTERLVLSEISTPDGTEDVVENMHLTPVHHHSATFEGLEADTMYAYRVRGARGEWSPWRQLRTAPSSGPVQFIFFGDAQSGIYSHVTRVFDTAAQIAPMAHFAIHGGDLVNTATYDKEWAEWFTSMSRTAVTLPSLLVTGNHDYVNFDKDLPRSEDGKLFVARKQVSPHWRPQFALPIVDDLPDDLAETVYDVRYGPDVHVMVLDSSGVAWDDQMAWLRRTIRGSDATWKIVTMHHPIHSFVGGREHPASRERRLAFLRELERGGIDLVLSGHRHTYQRGQYGDNAARFAVGEEQRIETVFLVTASTAKRGRTKVDGWQRYSEEQDGNFILERYADNTPIFGVFDVDGDSLSFRAVDAVGDVYDAFTLTKTSNEELILTNGDVTSSLTKTYENTGPYRNWDDLR